MPHQPICMKVILQSCSLKLFFKTLRWSVVCLFQILLFAVGWNLLFDYNICLCCCFCCKLLCFVYIQWSFGMCCSLYVYVAFVWWLVCIAFTLCFLYSGVYLWEMKSLVLFFMQCVPQIVLFTDFWGDGCCAQLCAIYRKLCSFLYFVVALGFG